MDIAERLAKERRARLAAERLLEQKSRELFAANEKLALHARALSDQIVEQRQVVKSALTQAEVLKGQNSRFLGDLEKAHTAAVMAERRLWDSINTIEDGFAVFDSNARLVAANRAYLAVFNGQRVEPGIGYAELLRVALQSGVVDLPPGGAEDWIAMMLSRWEGEVAEPIELMLQGGRWVRIADRRARDGDMVSLVLDITDQMRIWAAIEAIPDGFVLFDREERLLTCNQRYRDTYHESAPAMVPGARFEDILRFGLSRGQHLDAIGREEEWLATRLAQHRNPGAAVEQQLADGRWIRAQDHMTPDGGRVGLRVDITREKEQQKALEDARSAAEAASRAKSAFLANMSHEIRTPMNGVVGMAELLCDTALTEEQRLFAETIRSSGEALLVIINDILDYSKIEAERLTLYPEPFDLERTIHEVTMLLQPRAREKGLDLMIDYDMFLPTRYVGDPGRLRQVLTNLIGNAVKFTEAGHVLIRVVGLELDEGRQELHVTVEDTGIGIAPENLEHVFGEFNQVESQSNRKFEGTGLGLAITRRLIERMEGAVWVDSEFGRGSCFGFRLSLPVAEEAGAPRLPVDIRRALVVDDQFINRTILERQLVPCGIEVVLCRSGAEALAAAETAQFDVIITDHEMPEMDGLALTLRLRAVGVATPVILLSSNPGAAREEAGAAELAAVLQKPLLRADLYRRLQSLTHPAQEALPLPAPLAPGERRAMRVLAAEDNRTNQLVFQKMVRETGIELTFAGNGREAVELYRAVAPDLVFMDISMPEMDGRDAARAIRKLEAGRRHVPIVALTAHAMEGDAESILAAGIDRYMTKPLRKGAILDILAEFCPDEAHPVQIVAEAMTGT
ncbi:hybrid sensor histidine kinase/response regulator [Tabrizicola fusiformis]|uniref:hybrid sensor histidine kinase/response regulator n=1 Tax=Tabrizicola sp. SY72 TaxID=2741673 RepID=UPI00157439CE|nr:response regulator [Tabrizicola sp. SY72]NTT84487.1 response regulator [Tabrizicola sp. SY72]